MNDQIFADLLKNARSYSPQKLNAELARALQETRAELAASQATIGLLRSLSVRLAAPLDQDIRMEAYYFGFTKTGVAVIDHVLSRVAVAGKAYHHTDSWNDDPEDGSLSYVERIQEAADEAAAAILAVSRA